MLLIAAGAREPLVDGVIVQGTSVEDQAKEIADIGWTLLVLGAPHLIELRVTQTSQSCDFRKRLINQRV